MPLEPAFRGVAFAVLLFGIGPLRAPILGGDEFRRQRQDLLVAGRHDGGAQEGVEVFLVAVRTLPGGTTPAMNMA